jgi:hypothetical protein
MKRILSYISLFILVATLCTAVRICKTMKTVDHIYPRAATVIDIDEDAGTMLLEDKAGLTWIAGAEDFWYGDEVAMLMHDNNTPDWIYDDTILSIR